MKRLDSKLKFKTFRLLNESSLDARTGQRLFTPKLVAGKPNFNKVN